MSYHTLSTANAPPHAYADSFSNYYLIDHAPHQDADAGPAESAFEPFNLSNLSNLSYLSNIVPGAPVHSITHHPPLAPSAIKKIYGGKVPFSCHVNRLARAHAIAAADLQAARASIEEMIKKVDAMGGK